jgi:hypothetical protein
VGRRVGGTWSSAAPSAWRLCGALQKGAQQQGYVHLAAQGGVWVSAGSGPDTRSRRVVMRAAVAVVALSCCSMWPPPVVPLAGRG